MSVTGRRKKTMEARIAAKEWAANMMDKLKVPPADSPYIQAVLMEAALFEDPPKELSINLTQIGDFYMITIKGYENMIDLVVWVELFMGRERDDMLCRVTRTFVQTPPNEGPMMVIQMEKAKWHEATESAPRQIHKRKGGGIRKKRID